MTNQPTARTAHTPSLSERLRADSVTLRLDGYRAVADDSSEAATELDALRARLEALEGENAKLRSATRVRAMLDVLDDIASAAKAGSTDGVLSYVANARALLAKDVTP